MATAVDACSVAFVHNPALTRRRMSPSPGRVDRTAFGIVYQRTKQGCGRNPLDDRTCERSAVVHCGAIAAYAQDYFGRDCCTSPSSKSDERVGTLLRERRPPRPVRRVRGRVGPATSNERVDGCHQRGAFERDEPEPSDNHAVDIDPPTLTTACMLASLGLCRRLALHLPGRERTSDHAGGDALGELARLGLMLDRGDTRQRPCCTRSVRPRMPRRSR